MKIKKKYRFIDIQTDDFNKLTDISYLVDKTDFIDEIEEVRKKFGLDYNYPLSDIDSEKVENDFVYKLQFGNRELKEPFEQEVERIRKLYRIPPHFREVIKVSIIYGIVKDYDYSRAYLEEQEITPIRDPDEIPDIKYCIVIHSGTKEDDVKKVFKKFREKVEINWRVKENKREKHKNYNFGYWFDFSLTKPTNVKITIKKLRNLYLRRMNGESPLMIALTKCKTSKKEYIEISKKFDKENRSLSDSEAERYYKLLKRIGRKRDVVKSLIKRYRKFLKTPNTIL